MATATAQSVARSGTGDGHKHKKNALSDGQGRLAWMLLAPTLLVIIVVAGIPVLMSIREAFYRTNSGVDPNTGLIAGGEAFTGLKNFTAVFTGQDAVSGSYGSMGRPLGHPDDRVRSDVEADLRRGRCDEPDPGHADPLAG
jgi:ABC-type sugar transport system permease subunit